MPIRPATSSDVSLVLPMVRAQYAMHVAWDAAKFGVKEGFEAGFGRWMAGLVKDPRGAFFVATNDRDVPVGFLVATVERELPLYLLAEYAFIHDVWVEKDHRGKGLARGLVIAALEKFKAIGIRQVRCETAHINEDARKVFSKMGFRPTTVVMLKELAP
jgi:GNAT superfamily N-acetyltransferase